MFDMTKGMHHSAAEAQLHTKRLLSPALSTSMQLPFLVLIFTSSIIWSFAARRERLIDTWKPLHYNVSLTFNEQLTEITSARAEIIVLSLTHSLSQIDLDFGELAVDSVTVN